MWHFIREFVRHYELVYYMTLREIKSRYKQSVLGIGWAVFQPLAMIAIFTVIFSRVITIYSENVPYPIFICCALVPWIFFSSALQNATTSLVYHRSMIVKIYFPRIVMPLAAVFAGLFDFCIAMVLMLFLCFWYHIPLSIHIVWCLPVFAVQFILMMALAMGLSMLNVMYRDVKNAIGIILQLWMYCTPIIYPVALVPERFKFLYMLNPMTGIIDAYRRAVLHGMVPDMVSLGIAAGLSALLFALSYQWFKKLEGNLADYV